MTASAQWRRKRGGNDERGMYLQKAVRELKTVNVSDIIEYPTALGRRCAMLDAYGIDSYSDNEETITVALLESAANPDNLDICRTKCGCSAFYNAFLRGETPFMEKDSIRLSEWGGKYVVTEGKHRVCMAKRMGVKTILALVAQSNDGGFLPLPDVPNPGEFQATHSLNRGVRNGDAFLLWVRNTRAIDTFFDTPLLITESCCTDGEFVEVVSGVQYQVALSKVSILPFQSRKTKIDVKVVISEKHEVTGIWLMKVSMKKFEAPNRILLADVKTLYRKGCWKARHASTTIFFGGCGGQIPASQWQQKACTK